MLTLQIMQLLKWPFDKDEVTAVLATIERQKSILSLAVQNDHTGILRTISKGVQSMKTDVGAIRQGVAGLSIQQARNLPCSLEKFIHFSDTSS